MNDGTSLAHLNILPEEISGVHSDGRLAEKQGIVLRKDAKVYAFPKGTLSVVNEKLQGNNYYMNYGRTWGSTQLPQPETTEYNFFACQALENEVVAKQELGTEVLLIPRKHLFFQPKAFEATEELKTAVVYALRSTNDADKFRELEKVFKLFGYYYPHWILIGGKFTYKIRFTYFDSPKGVIGRAFREKVEWAVYGGDPSLLYRDNPDIEGWLESTKCKQVHIAAVDIDPVYDLFEHNVRSEIRRIYKAAYDERVPATPDNNIPKALISLPRKNVKVGATKGVFFDGSQSDEDAVELISENYIGKWMKVLAREGRPHISCMVRRARLSASTYTHGFLPGDSMDEPEKESGFMQAAIAHYIDSNRTKLRSKIQEFTYFVMYVTYQKLVLDPKYVKTTDNLKQAITKALSVKTDKEKYWQLQKVFQRFGYLYPSSILLGGRIMYRTNTRRPADDLLPKVEIETIDRLLQQNNYGQDIDIVGGSAIFEGCADWIHSVQTRQARIRFGSMKPMYELLDQDQQVQILRLYEMNKCSFDNFLVIPKGIHFDGVDAEQQAIEVLEDSMFSRMIRSRDLSSDPNVEHVRRWAQSFEIFKQNSSLDIDSEKDFPGSLGFVLGSQGTYKERKDTLRYDGADTETLCELVYITCKELHFYDEFIKPTAEFKEAVRQALETGQTKYDKYNSLQDVFQRFGYYYPTRIRIGGKLMLQVPSHDKSKPRQEGFYRNIKKRYDYYRKVYSDRPTEVQSVSRHGGNQPYETSNTSGTIIERQQNLFRQHAMRLIETSIDKSEQLNASGTKALSSFSALTWTCLGGDSVCLLWNNVKEWISSVETNEVVIQQANLKALYKVLDKEQQDQIEGIYHTVLQDEDRVFYECPLILVTYNRINNLTGERVPQDQSVTIDPWIEKLIGSKFHDSTSAIEFCRRICDGWEISIAEQKITDKFIRIYCLCNGDPEAISSNIKDIEQNSQEQGHKHLGQCKILLVKDEEGLWKFQKPRNYSEKEDLGSIASFSDVEKNVIFKLEPAMVHRSYGSTIVHNVKYGEMAYLRLIDSPDTAAMHMVNEETMLALLKSRRVPFCGGRKLERLYVSAHQCLWNTINSRHENLEHHMEEDDIKNLHKMCDAMKKSDADYLWKIVRYPSSEDVCRKVTEDQDTDNNQRTTESDNHVRKGDIVLFESQASLETSLTMYLCYIDDQLSFSFKENFSTSECRQAEWQIVRHIGISPNGSQWKTTQAIISELRNEGYRYSCKDMKRLKEEYAHLYEEGDNESYYSEHEDEDCSDLCNQRKLATHTMLSGVGDMQQSIELFQADIAKGHRVAYFKLAKLLWENKKYTEAFDMYEAAALLSVAEATGFSTDDLMIPKSKDIALVYYSIGAVHDVADAALKAARLYEDEPAHNDIKACYKKALRFYQHALQDRDIPAAWLAIGRIKHAMAGIADDLSEKEALRRGAFNAFAKVAKVEPYARYMLALYHLYGWNSQQPDATLGFQMLLDLIESGVREVMPAIARCYDGIGTERDSTKAAAYKELADRITTAYDGTVAYNTSI
ncbi:hypothetical protein EC973_000933 [Apophysomyces ossiformis]|uniref:Uncharacterized protein n=1 Tax=Apophysomyces ossiformis TaxID=679940 RepID=A0A8H7BK70_9FUNG|nr:hypothetical protein EC973_000933 [Apophysomyces ossiformis]